MRVIRSVEVVCCVYVNPSTERLGDAGRSMRVAVKGMETMDLPKGYRLLTTAPGVWVLVELYSTGRVVARYEGELDHERVEKDAREHAGSCGGDN